MAEPRRVPWTTLSSESPAPCEERPSPQEPPSGVRQAEEHRPETHTVRLDVSLFESDEQNFPEFSYSQLIDTKINHTKDRRDEEKGEEHEMSAVAKRLEEKYRGKPKKNDRIEDLIDIGYGYDDEDSFIDNSEAYDEFVPASITTRFGGFYVNSGELQFRQASDTETDTKEFTAEEKTLELSKKRKHNGRQDKPKKKRCRESKDMQNNMDSKSSTLSETGPNDELKRKKKKTAVSTLSVTSMLKKFQREKERERQKTEKANQKAAMIMEASTMVLSPADAGGGGGLMLPDPLLSLIGSTNDHALIQAASTMEFDIDLDSLLEVSEDTLVPKPLSQPSTEESVQPTDDQNPVTISDKPQTQNIKTNLQLKPHQEATQLLSQAAPPQQCVPLPEGLPLGLEDGIRRLMVAAKTSEGESKLKFFSPEINSILLNIELQCREQGAQTRSRVYTHLASFLPCSRDTLLKRVKKLLATHVVEAPDAQDPIQKLKQAIARAMPEQLACYHENCQAYEQAKLSKATEDRKGDNVVTEDNVEEKGGRRGGPKKLFKWNQDIRECLAHVLRPRVEKFTKERKGSQEMEEYLKTFLDNEVKPLWPKGWMQSRVLVREIKNLLGLFTSLPVKKARSETKQSDISLQATQPKGELQVKDDFINAGEGCLSLGSVRKEDAALKRGDSKKGQAVLDPRSSASEGSGKLLDTSAPAQSLLALLADQALSKEQPGPGSQELLIAAIAKYKHSLQHLGLSVDTKSPPLPPPPPQSSPVSFPVTGVCHVVVPQVLQGGDFTRHIDVGNVQIISDDAHTTME